MREYWLTHYTHGLWMCIKFMEWVMIDNAPGGSKLAIFFEAGHASSGKSKEILDKVMVGEQGSKYEIFTGYTFAKKGELCLLEAADMHVWQTTKYIKHE